MAGRAGRFSALRDATISAVLGAKGVTPAELRRSIAAGTPPEPLADLVRRVRDAAYTVTDQQVDALRPRYSEPELFEIIVAAAVGAAADRLRAAHAALEDA